MTQLVFDVLFQAEEADLEAEIAKAQASLDRLNAQKVNPKIDADILAEEAKLAQVNAKLDELRAKPTSAKIDADILALEAKAAQATAKLDELNTKKVTSTIDVEIAAGEAKVAALKAELDSIRNQHVEVNVDVDSGVANVRRLSTEVDGLIAKVAGAGPNFFSLGGLITTALIPGIQSIGQLSGALGLIPAMAAGAGTAFGTVAIGVQGIDTAFKASEASIKANEAAFKADAVAQQAHTAAVQAGTSTGQANIAMLQQAVTQGAAHVAQLQAQAAAGQNVTTQLKAAQAEQAANTAALKTAQAAYTGSASAVGSYTSAQKTASDAASKAKTAHEEAAKAADAEAAAMKGIAPAAQGVVSALIQLKPAYDALHIDVQQHLFDGLKQTLLDTANTALPVVRTGLDQMATSLNTGVNDVASFIQQQSSVSAWKEIFTNLATSATNFDGAIKPILQIITDVTQAGSQFLPELATDFAHAAQEAADFVSKAKDTGQLHEWIQTGIDAVQKLWGIFSDLVQIIAKVTEAPGPGLLDMVKGILDVVLQLITQFPILISLVEAFIAVWVVAKVITAITGMITKIQEAATAVGLLTAAEEANATAATEAGAANEAAATKAGAGWKAAGLLIGAFFAGEFLKQAGAPLDPNQDWGTSSFKQKWQDASDTAGDVLTLNFGALFTKIGSDINRLPQDTQTAWSRIQQASLTAALVVKNAWSSFTAGFVAPFQQAASAAEAAWSGVSSFFSGLWSGIRNGLQSFTAGFVAPFQQAASLVEAAWSGVSGFFSGLWSGISSAAQTAWNAVTTVVSTAWTSIQNAVSTGAAAVQTALSTAWTEIQTAATTAWTAVTTAVSTAWTSIQSAVSTGIATVQSALQTGWDAVTSAVTTAWGAISSAVQTGISTVVGFVQGLPGQITSAIGDLGSILTNAGQSAMQGLYNAMINFYNSTIAPWLQSIANSVASLKGPADKDYYILQDAGTAIMAGLHDSMQARWGPIEDWLSGLGGQISDTVDAGVDSTVVDDTSTSIPAAFQTSVSKVTGPKAPYITHPNYDFDALYNYLYPPPPPPPPSPPPTGGGGGHGHHGGHGSGGWDIGQLQNAFRDALHDVFSGGIRTDVDYNSLTLRLNQVTRLNARR